MINSKDTKVIKELVTNAVYQATGEINQEIKKTIEKCFDVVIKEMKDGSI